MPRNEGDTPSVNTPYETIAANVPAGKSKDDYLCVVHSNTRPKVLGLNIRSMPPSPGDLFGAVMTAVSPHIPAHAIGKIKFGVVDGLGVWSYKMVDPPQRLRQQIRVQKDLDTYIKENQHNYNMAMRAGLEWTVHAGEIGLRSNYRELSDAQKVEILRNTRKYREFQKAYLDAGFVVTYASRDEAAKGAPCDDRVGK